ncbi:MAG: threonylcarbamoyl-AMP synthase [Deltaproteobacteria bacterium]|nr:threonylcarbamoyl-AMP synthase [Deltaproteobacteria bacterium]
MLLDHEAVVDAKRALDNGKIVLYPTETLWGLGVNPMFEPGLRRLAALKARHSNSPFMVLVQNLKEARKWGVFDDTALALAKEFWPGPLSLVMPATNILSKYLMGPGGTIGLRVSSHPVARALVKEFGPITSTSANRAGQRPPAGLSEVDPRIMKACHVVDGGPEPAGVASTVVATTDMTVRVLREGVISESQVFEALDRIFPD